jgi:hypothetical protein
MESRPLADDGQRKEKKQIRCQRIFRTRRDAEHVLLHATPRWSDARKAMIEPTGSLADTE